MRQYNNKKKSKLIYWDIVLGILLIIYTIAINMMSKARVAFSVPLIGVAVILMIYHFVKDTINHKRKYDTSFKKVYKFIVGILCVGLAFFIALESMIIIFPKYDKSKSDYIVVLGAGLWEGYYPTQILRDRLDAAIEYSNLNDNDEKIVVSGGQGDDEDISEASAMKSYLIDKGVDENRIIMEDKSRNTTQNLKYSKEKIQEDSGKNIEELKVTIVTTEFHALRSNFLAKRCGYTNVSNYSGKTVWYLIPIMYVRESFALVKSALFDK